MNKEGYKTPTEDIAISRETLREKLRRQYGIKEGNELTIAIEVTRDGKMERQKVRVKVKEIHKYFVTLQMPAGYCKSMMWDDFRIAKAEGEKECKIPSGKKTKRKKNT